MPAVFVHGVPDTAAVWRRVIELLRRDDVVALSLPGFGAAAPAGFEPIKEAYVEWLLAELHKLGEPIDLVGHDWGGMIVVRAVSLEPSVARTWTAGGGPIDTEYEWHQTARLWQTPGVGEQLMETLTREALRDGLAAAGVPAEAATEAAVHVDQEMKRCILALYRSAISLGIEWEPGLKRVSAPGLVIWGREDPYANVRFGARLADRTAARFVPLAGCSHWWQLEKPEEVAAELEAHWSSAG